MFFRKIVGMVSYLIMSVLEKNCALCHFQATKIYSICGAIVLLLNGVALAAAVTFLGLDPRTRDPRERASESASGNGEKAANGRPNTSLATEESFKVAKFSVGGRAGAGARVVRASSSAARSSFIYADNVPTTCFRFLALC